jgi:hypothetical protein
MVSWIMVELIDTRKFTNYSVLVQIIKVNRFLSVIGGAERM